MVVHLGKDEIGSLICTNSRDFPGSPVVKTLSFQCRGHGFNPWLGN